MMSRRKQTSHLPNTSNHVPKDDSASAYKNMKNSIKQDGQTEEHSFTAVKRGTTPTAKIGDAKQREAQLYLDDWKKISFNTTCEFVM